MRISLQFFADIGKTPNGDTIIGPPEPPTDFVISDYGPPDRKSVV